MKINSNLGGTIMINSVDRYIDDFSFYPLAQERLTLIRNVALKVFPKNVIEIIYHGVPTFLLNEVDILNYGAYKKHITLYLGYYCAELIQQKYPSYSFSKSSMIIKYDEVLDSEMIENICKIIISNL